MSLWSTQTPSPIGTLRLVAQDDALVALLWENDCPARVKLAAAQPCEDHPILTASVEALAAYFAGARRTFDVSLRPAGTAFQQAVWAALCTIPFGETRSYGAIAQQLGLPVGAARAVGAANGKNPISILVPCHRVVGANGQLTGFAGGLAAKAFLLALERKHPGVSSEAQMALALG